jgi:tetratricopeptide (TPR) repeat protein
VSADRAGVIGVARDALNQQQWDDAAAAFAAADAAAPLGADDLLPWAMASYLLGRTQDTVDVLTRAHHLFLSRSAVDDAVRCGFWIVYALVSRSEMGRAGGWLTRCDRLLSQYQGSGLGKGYLLAFDSFRAAAIDHDYSRARVSTAGAVRIGREHGDADLVALALTSGGRAMIRSGAGEEGLSCLDDAMVSVLADEVSAVVAGTVYCSVIDACEEVFDIGRAAEWTEALTSWCDNQHGMLTFNGQCLTHRATVLRVGGQLEEAAQAAARACDRFTGAADEAAKGRAIYELAQVQRVRGDLSAAEEDYHRAAEWGHDPQPGLALLRLAQGRPGAASAMMRRLMAEASSRLDRLRLLPAFVEVMLDAGDTEEAATAAQELQSWHPRSRPRR